MSKIFHNIILFEGTTLNKSFRGVVFVVLVFLCTLFLLPNTANAARLSASPTTGTFEVDSTFSVSILLDSEEESINAFDVVLHFPSDKLQLVSPSIGKSIVEVWTGPPQYNNVTGVVRFQGGIPNGITASRGLVTELTFRVKQVGTAILSFADTSKVLRNDGKGTYVLNDTTRGVYQLILPPPAGPIVASETHPDQSVWYSRSDVIFQWGSMDDTVSGFSYMLNKDPTDIPDDITDGKKTNVSYTRVSDGTHYFHIKSLRGNAWGGTTHFAVNVDTKSPAEFAITVSPSDRTTNKNPIILFETTDKHSGIDHYEMRVIPLYKVLDDDESFFIEANTRQILDLDLGRYDVVVRAYDHAANVREVIKKITIVRPIFQVIQGQGLQIVGIVTIPWRLLLPVALAIIIALVLLGIRARRKHRVARDQQGKLVIKNKLRGQIEELKEYRNKYVKIIVFLILSSSLMFGSDTAVAQTKNLPPPFISTISENISNEDIFYVGGRTGNPGGEVIFYLQNLQTGEVFSHSVTIEEGNEWFYRHDSFLTSGDYTVWAQQQLGEQISAPSPQTNLHVRTTAIQFGSSRLSLEIVYLLLSILLLLVIISLVGYITFHSHHERKWRARFIKEVNEAEDALRHGFMILRRDIQAELAIIQQAKLQGTLAEEEEKTEMQLLEDLEQIEKNIGKEILDIEQLEQEE